MFFAYTSEPENLRRLLELMRTSPVPKKVRDKYLRHLILPGTGQIDSLRAVLRFLDFVDESGASTPRWRKYVEARSGTLVLREIVQQKYADLFRLHADAPVLSEQQLADIVITNTTIKQVTNAHAVAVTFKTLCALAKLPEPRPSSVLAAGSEPVPQHCGRHVAACPQPPILVTPCRDRSPKHVPAANGDEYDPALVSVDQTSFIQDALRCIQEGLFRAAYVMAWTAFMDFYENRLAADGLAAVRDARPSWGSCNRSLAEMREHYPEAQLLEVGVDVHLLSWSEYKVLEGLHARRNQCAHPSEFVPDEQLARGYLYELVQIMTKLGRTRPHFVEQGQPNAWLRGSGS